MNSGITKNLKPLILFLGALLFFSFLKIPQGPALNYLMGTVQKNLDPLGILILDQGKSLSYFSGFEIRLDHPTLELSDGTRIEWDEIKLRPAWSLAFKGLAGIQVRAFQGAGTLELIAGGRGDQIHLDLNLQQIDISRLGIFQYLAQLRAKGFASGTFKIKGKLADPNSLQGGTDLKIKSLSTEAQTLFGFELPDLQIQEAVLGTEISQGKLNLKNIQVGRPASQDDLMITMTGGITLQRHLNSSPVNARLILGLSEKIKSKMSLLDTLLAPAKQSDGRYAYLLTGSLGAPFPQPDPKQ